MTVMADPKDDLAAAVEDRIDELGLEYTEVARRAGFSVETLSKIRRGDRVRTKTLRRLEDALQRPRGWADGSRPEPDEEASPPTGGNRQPGIGTGRITGMTPLDSTETLAWQPDEDGVLYTLVTPGGSSPVRPSAVFGPESPVGWVVSELRRLARLSDAAEIGHHPPEEQGKR